MKKFLIGWAVAAALVLGIVVGSAGSGEGFDAEAAATPEPEVITETVEVEIPDEAHAKELDEREAALNERQDELDQRESELDETTAALEEREAAVVEAEEAPEPEPEPADELADDTVGGHEMPAEEDLYLDSLDDVLVNSYSPDELLTYGYAVCDQMEAMHDDGDAADVFGPDNMQAFADEHGLDSFDAGAIQGAAGSLCPSVSLKVSEDALDELDY